MQTPSEHHTPHRHDVPMAPRTRLGVATGILMHERDLAQADALVWLLRTASATRLSVDSVAAVLIETHGPRRD